MRQKKIVTGFTLIALTAFVFAGCKSQQTFDLSKATQMQRDINNISDNNPIPLLPGKEFKIKFAGTAFEARLDGRIAARGEAVFTEDGNGGATIKITPKQTFSYEQNPLTKRAVGWIPFPSPTTITATYKPPATLTVQK